MAKNAGFTVLSGGIIRSYLSFSDAKGISAFSSEWEYSACSAQSLAITFACSSKFPAFYQQLYVRLVYGFHFSFFIPALACPP